MSEAKSNRAAEGVVFGLGAYGIWGLLPLYFRWIGPGVAATEVLAQRILWSLLLVGLLIVATRRTTAMRRAFADRRSLLFLCGSAILIAGNWLIYIWAVTHGHVLEASLGYFLNPLINVMLGMALLKERLRPLQSVAVLLATAGVTVLAVGAGTGLWISLGLAMSFAFYGLLRKLVAVESLEGLGVETLILAPFAVACLIWLGTSEGLAFGGNQHVTLLLVLAGPVTAIPLLLFAAAARRMAYATLGLLQYLAPTLQFLLAVTLFGEHVTVPHIICFSLIWIGLLVFATDALRGLRRSRAGAAKPA